MHPSGADQEPLASTAVQVKSLTLAASIAMLNIPYPDPAGQQTEVILVTGGDSVCHNWNRSPR
jgi:hypothetical protein